jgi:hypothetical protein
MNEKPPFPYLDTEDPGLQIEHLKKVLLKYDPSSQEYEEICDEIRFLMGG